MGLADATQLAFVLQGSRTGPSVVQLMAARNGEGTSTLCRDLCLVAASNGLRSLLFAAEMPKRRGDWAREIYGLPSGLREMTGGPASLQMLRVGDTPLGVATPSSMLPLQGPVWAPVIARLRELFDFIVIDAPALARSFTGIMLAPHVDETAIVVAAESTRASTARALRDRLAEVGGETAGIILNKRRFHVPRVAYDRL